MYVVLLGLPGAGKGTQAEFLCRRLGIGHLTTGEMFRDHIRRRTPLGQMAQPYVEGGQLVPDEVTIAMVVEELEGPRCGSGCLLDGFPRTLAQARALDEALARRGKAIDAVIYLRVPEEEVVRRLSGRWTCSQCGAVYHEVNSPPATPGVCDACGAPLYQREDDRPEVVRRRLEVNRRQLEELLDYYRRQGKLREVDGFKSIEEVQGELLEVLMGARRG
jgi:adenylate kinase